MRGRGSDQGGHWPVGIWFAMVGVSAGTVASFSLIGWTFAKDLYGGGDGTEPLGYDPQTVVIEADETPVGVTGGDEGPLGPAGPEHEPQIAVSPAEPQAERIVEADEADDLPELDPREEAATETSTPPQLVPVEDEDDDCGREEAAPDGNTGADHNGGNGNGEGQGQGQGQGQSQGQGQGQGQGRGNGDHWDRPDLPELDLELDLDLDAVFDQADIELDLEYDAATVPELEPEDPSDAASEPAPGGSTGIKD